MKTEEEVRHSCEVFVKRLQEEESTQATVAFALTLNEHCSEVGLQYGAWERDTSAGVILACSLLSLALEVGSTDYAKEGVAHLVFVFSEPDGDFGR